MYTRGTIGDKTVLWEWHLCLRCYRMFLLNTTPHFRIVHEGQVIHIHMACPPLKQPLRNELK